MSTAPATRPSSRRSRAASVALLALALLAAAPAARAADAVPGLRGELLRTLDDAKGKVIDLAQAMPEDKYGWRPGKGVRSVGEVYLHIAASNYNLAHMAGVAIPEGIDAKAMAGAKLTKEQTIDALTKSFAHAEAAITNTPDTDLDKPADIFGREGTVREAFVILCTHAHEHLGQSIAYARTNGVVPPWTAKAEAEAAAKKAQTPKPGDKS